MEWGGDMESIERERNTSSLPLIRINLRGREKRRMERNMVIRSIITVYIISMINEIYKEVKTTMEKKAVILIIIILTYYIFKDWRSDKYSINKGRINNRGWEEETIIVILILGILSLLNMENLISLFISLEIISIITYSLLYKIEYNEKYGYVGNYNNILYYFFINTLSSLLLLYSFLIFYRENGSVLISNIETGNMIPIYLALMIKLGAGPFYYWKVIVYSKIEKNKILFITIIPNFIYLYILSIFILDDYKYILYIFIILSLLIGSIAYLSTDYFNRLIIYSSTYNIGLIIYNICLSSEIPYGYNNYLYIIVYSINIIGLVYTVWIYSGSPYRKEYIHLIIMNIMIFSLIGFPPFGGFFIKFYLIYNSILIANPISYFFSFLILLTSIMAIPLYLKFLSGYYLFYKDLPKQTIVDTSDISDSLPSSISLSTLFLLSFYYLSPYLTI